MLGKIDLGKIWIKIKNQVMSQAEHQRGDEIKQMIKQMMEALKYNPDTQTGLKPLAWL